MLFSDRGPPFNLFFKSHHLSFRNSHVTFLTSKCLIIPLLYTQTIKYTYYGIQDHFWSVTKILCSLIHHPIFPPLHPKQLPMRTGLFICPCTLDYSSFLMQLILYLVCILEVPLATWNILPISATISFHSFWMVKPKHSLKPSLEDISVIFFFSPSHPLLFSHRI